MVFSAALMLVIGPFGDQRGGRAALAVVAVAGGAFLRVNRRALRGGAAAGGQPRAVGHDAAVPRREVGGGDRLAEIGPVGRRSGARAEREHRSNDSGTYA